MKSKAADLADFEVAHLGAALEGGGGGGVVVVVGVAVVVVGVVVVTVARVERHQFLAVGVVDDELVRPQVAPAALDARPLAHDEQQRQQQDRRHRHHDADHLLVRREKHPIRSVDPSRDRLAPLPCHHWLLFLHFSVMVEHFPFWGMFQSRTIRKKNREKLSKMSIKFVK